MNQGVSFRARARAIDHLGREQIADVPTAISELWKNSYDAYATEVSLDIYSDEEPVAGLYDNGFGMSKDTFLNRWLVVGTETKLLSPPISEEDRRGLPLRPIQGQKGIGRLSVGALGSRLLLVSKTQESKFLGSLIDWRLFENPFLDLQDIKIPIVEFESLAEFKDKAEELVEILLANVNPKNTDEGRYERLTDAWDKFDKLEQADGKVTTSSLIVEASRLNLSLKYLESWEWTSTGSGTALIIFELNDFLKAWTYRGSAAESEEVKAVKHSLVRTLTDFIDPYGSEHDFSYRVRLHRDDSVKTVIEPERDFGLSYLYRLDHCLDGIVDEQGLFKGRVRAFGIDLGEQEILPLHPPPTHARSRVGSFAITLGIFEGDQKSSVLSSEAHQLVEKRAYMKSGLNVYRDGLRVMPYGRPENDFFKIEERRQKHAGREFWASRRLFGRIALTRSENPNLRDKAGREGIIDNRASRELQILVINILKQSARLFYGQDSEVRKEHLPAIQARNEEAAQEAKDAKKSKRRIFLAALKANRAPLTETVESANKLTESLETLANHSDLDSSALWVIKDQYETLEQQRKGLRLPPVPKKLGRLTDRYREYRDDFAFLARTLEEANGKWSELVASANARPVEEIVDSHLSRNQSELSARLTAWRRRSRELLESELKRVEDQVAEDLKRFYREASPLRGLIPQIEGSDWLNILESLDQIRDSLFEIFENKYESYIRALELLAEGIDLDSALGYLNERNTLVEKRIQEIEGLAQIGIAVEIVSHELTAIEARLRNAMEAFPVDVKKTKTFEAAVNARSELVGRLRFLSEMQLSPSDIKRKITGLEIFNYLKQFYRTAFAEHQIEFTCTRKFEKFSLTEFASRIYPVFINLVNNSIYWLAKSPVKKIILDATDDTLMISDSGPGIDPEDVEEIFDLFFTRSIRGRGVGLYLCRSTLAAGGHTIRYEPAQLDKGQTGAKFIIEIGED